MAPPRPCQVCGDFGHHESACPMLQPGAAPAVLGYDPYEVYNPSVQIGHRQLELAESNQRHAAQMNEALGKMLLLLQEQTQELKALKAEVASLKALPASTGRKK